MTTFLEELERQLTDAAHRRAARRPRRPWRRVAMGAPQGDGAARPDDAAQDGTTRHGDAARHGDAVRRGTRAPWRGPAAASVVAVVILALGFAAAWRVPDTTHAPAERPASTATPAPATPTPSPRPSLAGAQVEIVNAAGVPAVASSAAAQLMRLGARARSRATERVRPTSVVTGDAPQARRIAAALDIANVEPGPDLTVYLGTDYLEPASALHQRLAILRRDGPLMTTAGRVQVIGNRTGACLSLRNGWTCTTTARTLAGWLMLSRRGDDDALLAAVGVVPDDIDHVELRLADGTTRTAPVTLNVWSTTENVRRVTVGARTLTVP
ncbi:MAG TPA: LytR C-terminal domain-containing protein [Solirubrobacter sp.]|nr:LytR C-terminal domain-containing protein [Solirubrobacter sp.]